MKKETFIRRFHMSLVLTATCLSGVLFSKLLLPATFSSATP
jgi:hypothetical protein